MKIQIYLFSLLVSLSIFGCFQNSSEKNLNGRWYGIENNGYTSMHFYPDSLVFTEEFEESVSWNATRSKIKFMLPSNLWLIDSSKNVTVNYKISDSKDTLFCNFITPFGENRINLLRAKNYTEFLAKKYEIELSLPQDDLAKYLEVNKTYGLNVFLGYSNNTIVGKTELSENLDHLEFDSKRFKDSIKSNGRLEVDMYDRFYDRRFHIRVFADKNISDSIITSCLPVTIKRKYSKFIEGFPERFREPVRDTLPIKIYRIYQSEEEVEFSKIKGKEIKSLAKYVYY